MALINRDKKFCEAVSAIYTAAGCGSLPATGNSGASLVLTQNVGGMPRKVKPDFRQALSQGVYTCFYPFIFFVTCARSSSLSRHKVIPQPNNRHRSRTNFLKENLSHGNRWRMCYAQEEEWTW
eukprot:TRINITY_DN7907_c0_g1_i2.p1 TRINITY_DN7907_c0_g1~~TRINITY_DN7907_c0_g1_i2.p1  ORF type:complete len:123 (+),score=8.98 TRINITY_DN7907_c0_g1_i2:315-683(+)